MPAQDIRTDPESQARPPVAGSRVAPGRVSGAGTPTPDFLEEMRQAALVRVSATPTSSADPRRLDHRPARSLAQALATAAREHGCGVIAEVKRRSPSAGALREDLDPAALARSYAEAGAAAVSIVTEPTRFGGSLADLERAVAAAPVPVLRKDFLLEPDQIRESREAGADAVLLIVRLLDPLRLLDLLAASAEVGLEALVEVHGTAELRLANEAGAALVGVNNRDLTTLQTDVSHSLEVARRAREQGLAWPDMAVSESGIRTRRQVEDLARAGYHAVLVGETLLRAPDPARAVRELLGMEAR